MSSRPSGKTVRTALTAVIGLVIVIAVFAFLFPQMGDYRAALTQIADMAPIWIAALAVASAINIGIYPFTTSAAMPEVGYRTSFINRQAGFSISNILPGGGALAAATQYAILARYGVEAARAAAAVTADAIWTYLLILGAPAVAVTLLVADGHSATAYVTIAGLGLGAVVMSILGIVAVLRSETTARRVGEFLQSPANKLYSLIRKTPPDLSEALANFNKHASVMVSTRWKQLTLTNVAAQMAPILVLVVGLAALGVFPDPVNAIEVFAAFSISLILTSIPLTPGGLGTVDAALVALLVAFGCPAADAIAADLIWRLAWFVPQLLVGLTALGIYAWDRRRQPLTSED
ncbi:MAG: lysylphosphatidylglycerol synthase transmembrane domain-containing protein [Actinomycetota bacterium]|nr:lysylphosphatidylglycerol synthase transmembrane domain-containing protein [Actinomycetota bacterium]